MSMHFYISYTFTSASDGRGSAPRFAPAAPGSRRSPSRPARERGAVNPQTNLSLSLYIYIYMYMCIYIYIYIAYCY